MGTAFNIKDLKMTSFPHKQLQKSESGFTLVELAIVLVIIGLIVGGVLVGQDLIKAAEIRSVVTTLEKYNAGATTFRSKYDGYPGDITSTKATNFGLTAGAGTDGLGDGDGVLENGATTADKQGVGGESTLFWRHLSDTQLISEGFTTANGTVAVALGGANPAVSLYLPHLKIRDSANVHTTGIGGKNYFYLTGVSTAVVTTGAITESAALSPAEAQSIDSKIDDGLYGSGTVIAVATLAAATAGTIDPGAAAASGVCVNSTPTPDVYNTASQDFASAVACHLRIRSSF
jgi:prepilin-type N-terminal cleavage/methylation domain-containing protein